MPTPLKLSNNAVSKLAAPITAAATTLTLTTGTGALFPLPVGVEYFMLTIRRQTDGLLEIVRATSRSGDSVTITRAQEGTTALAFETGDIVELRLTAGSLVAEFDRLENTPVGTDRLQTESVTTDKVAPRAINSSKLGLVAQSVTISGSVALNLALANYFQGTATENTTFTFSNPPPSGIAYTFALEIANGGSFAITWPLAVRWPGGLAPTLTATGVDILVFVTDDGGSNYRGTLVQKDSR